MRTGKGNQENSVGRKKSGSGDPRVSNLFDIFTKGPSTRVDKEWLILKGAGGQRKLITEKR